MTIYNIGYFVTYIVTVIRTMGFSLAKVFVPTYNDFNPSVEVLTDPFFLNWLYFTLLSPKKVQILTDALMSWVFGWGVVANALSGIGLAYYLSQIPIAVIAESIKVIRPEYGAPFFSFP